MSDLEHYIKTSIEKNGPITVAEYMSLCLGHPDYGYYMKQDPFGQRGDFTTAPEISQLFGEMIGAWVLQTWHDIGEPKAFHLVECGPGRGTLMQDILRVLQIKPNFLSRIHVHMIEMSPTLRARQQDTLNGFSAQIEWHESLSEITCDAPVIFVMNEFFDALPIHQFICSKDKWFERYVGLDDQDHLQWQNGTPGFIPTFLEHDKAPSEGDILEFSPASISVMSHICQFISEHDGVALCIDYGHKTSGYGDTLQAIKDHEYTDVFSTPGHADITAHVDFQRLQETAMQYNVHTQPIVPQGAFLKHLGIEHRAKYLIQRNPNQSDKILSGLSRLVENDQMGQLFKVLALSKHEIALAGFENVYV